MNLVFTLTSTLGAALVLGYLARRLGWSPIVGYLVSGVLVGPHTPGFVANGHLAEQLAEIGVILLMFGVGLQFHVEHLVAVWRVAVPGAIVQSLIATGLGALVVRLFGWDWTAGLVFGAALSVASTVVLVRVLTDSGDLHSPTGRIAVGWLVVEDLFTVVLLVVLPAVASQSTHGHVLSAVAVTLLKLCGLVALILVAGQRVIPQVLTLVSKTGSRELFTLAVLVIALSLAVGSAAVFGVSMALGAFLAGMVVARTPHSLQAASEAMPMRDAFAVLFFVSVGMLLDPRELMTSAGIVLAALAIVLVGKPLAALIIVRLMRYPLSVAAAVAVSLAQIGEFSFILVGVGRRLDVVPIVATQIVVAAAIVSIVVNPTLYTIASAVKREGDPMKVKGRLMFGALAGTLMTLGGFMSARQVTRPAPRRLGQMLSQRISAEYREMPGLCLTTTQAARLFGVNLPTADDVLRDLEREGVLRSTADGRFVVAGV